MMGFGISALVFGTLANALFSSMEWTTVFILIAAVAFVVMILLAFIIKPAPKDIGALLGVPPIAAGIGESSTQQMFPLKSKAFWFFWVWAILIVAAGLTLIGTSAQGAAFAETGVVGNKVAYGALLVGLVSTMNGISRIVNGALFDKIGLVPVMLFSCVVCFLCAVGLSFSLANGIVPLYIVAAILIALPYGSAPVLSASFMRQRYGAKNFATNLGIVNLCIAIAATLNIVIGFFLGSAAAENGPIIYGIMGGLIGISFVGALLFSRQYKADLATIKEELS